METLQAAVATGAGLVVWGMRGLMHSLRAGELKKSSKFEKWAKGVACRLAPCDVLLRYVLCAHVVCVCVMTRPRGCSRDDEKDASASVSRKHSRGSSSVALTMVLFAGAGGCHSRPGAAIHQLCGCAGGQVRRRRSGQEAADGTCCRSQPGAGAESATVELDDITLHSCQLCQASLHRTNATKAPSSPPATTCTFVCPSVSRNGRVSRTGCSGGSS